MDRALQDSELHSSCLTGLVLIVNGRVFFVLQGIPGILELRPKIFKVLSLIFSHEYFCQLRTTNLALGLFHNEAHPQAASNAHVLMVANTNQGNLHLFLAQYAVL